MLMRSARDRFAHTFTMGRRLPGFTELTVARSVAIILIMGMAIQQVAASTDTLFQIRDGRVQIPEWDTQRPARRGELRLMPSDFVNSPHVYRNRIIFQQGSLRTRPIDVPATATEFFLYGRGTPEEDIFPRIRVFFEYQDAGTTRSLQVFYGVVQSRVADFLRMQLPGGVSGRTGQFVVEFLNPSRRNDWRTLYVAFVGLR